MIAFYLSGHGFGHASRQVEVINALGVLESDRPILIRSAVSPDLLRRTLRVPYTLLPGACDTGIVQTSSVAHDDEATAREAAAFYASIDERVDAEAAALPAGVRLIVGDIPPLAFDVAARLGIPSIAIGNFTWDWIYETAPGFEREHRLVDRLRAAYKKASLALQLPFAGGFEVFPSVRPIPLIARHATRSREDTRARFSIDANRPAVLLSFGGYGLPDLTLTDADCLNDWTVVTTDRTTPEAAAHPSVTHVSESALTGTGFRYEDVVAAVDVVLTKPGYGIIAECIAARTPMLYTSRGQFREYDLLVRESPRYLRTRFLSQADLFGGRWRASLEALLQQPPPADTLSTDGAIVAAAIIDRRPPHWLSSR